MKSVKMTERQLEVCQIVFDQLCCDHFRDQVGKTPYSFDEEEGEFIGLLDLFEKKLDTMK